MRKISIISLLLVISMAIVGCTSDELKLYKAFEKSSSITSMESKTDISFKLGIDNVPEEDQQQVEQIISMFNDFKINTHQKTISNKEKTATKAEAEVGINFSGIGMDMQVWIDADMSGETPKMKEIIKMPSILMSSLSLDSQNKEYLVYDMGQIINENQEQFDFNKLMNLGKDMEVKLTSFIKEQYLNFDPGFKIATSKGKKTIDGEELSIYEVKLDDAAFKKLIRNSVNDLLDNKDVVEFVKEYMNVVIDAVEVEDSEKQLAKEEINQELSELESNIPELKNHFNEFMDNFDKVKVLGDKGITIEYGVNKDGYITHEEGVIDILIDVASIDNVFNNDTLSNRNILGEKAPIIRLDINFKTNTYNINKDMEITMPDVNSDNAIYINDLMK